MNVIRTKEYFLKDDDFLIFEYNKRLREKEVPLLVLTYTPKDGIVNTKHEVVWGLGEMENEMQIIVKSVLDHSA